MSKEACNAANREFAQRAELDIRQTYFQGMREHLYRVRMNSIYRAFCILGADRDSAHESLPDKINS